LDEEFHFDFDPCPLNAQFDESSIEWGKYSYVNPPYSESLKWVKKAYEESLKGKTVVMLIPSRMGRDWFHDYILPHAEEIRFVRGRLHFSGHRNSAPFNSIIVVFSGKRGWWKAGSEPSLLAPRH